jgi:transmembrane sensor
VSAPVTSHEPAAVRAEAAAWVARLRGPERDAATEAAFRRWLESDPAHAAAFDRATDIWQAIGGAAAMTPRKPAVSRRTPVLAGLAAAVVLGGLGGAYALRDPSYATHVGEQRSVRLADGSRIALNTDTKVVVRYSEGRRDIRLVRGEAQFDVAKNPNRPFVVTAEGQQVRALGTSFIVRDDGKAVAVTLLEGKVSVTPVKASPATKVVTLVPGQRLRTSLAAAAIVDRPKLEAVTAWRSGEILLDDTTLAQAVSELNRYSERPLALENEAIGALRISGIFRSGESEAFARTISAQYQLAVIEQDGRILIAEAPTPREN